MNNRKSSENWIAFKTDDVFRSSKNEPGEQT
jgi:hypothetical protein